MNSGSDRARIPTATIWPWWQIGHCRKEEPVHFCRGNPSIGLGPLPSFSRLSWNGKNPAVETFRRQPVFSFTRKAKTNSAERDQSNRSQPASRSSIRGSKWRRTATLPLPSPFVCRGYASALVQCRHRSDVTAAGSFHIPRPCKPIIDSRLPDHNHRVAGMRQSTLLRILRPASRKEVATMAQTRIVRLEPGLDKLVAIEVHERESCGEQADR
jgi:hypothetical protein